MRVTIGLLLAIIAVAICVHFTQPAMADPGDICSLVADCSTGETCKVSAAGQQGLCVAGDATANSDGDNISKPTTPNISQPVFVPGAVPGRMLCYDIYNRPWCQVLTGIQFGAVCACAGIQGIGRQAPG